MPLKKTIIYPGQDPESTIQLPALKLVIIADNNTLVTIADNLAQYPPTSVDRYVIWFKEPAGYNLHQRFPDLPADLSTVCAFSLSIKNKVADLILTSETLDYVRIDFSFTQAGLPKYN